VKLYMGEAGRARGIKGWRRSGSDLRKSLLSLEEINGFVDSHHHLSEDEGDYHNNCIFVGNGICTASIPQLTDDANTQLLLSPTSTQDSSEFSSEFSHSPPSSPSDYHDSPIIPLGHFEGPALFERTLPSWLSFPPTLSASSTNVLLDTSPLSYQGYTEQPRDMFLPQMGMCGTDTGSWDDIQYINPQLFQSNAEPCYDASLPQVISTYAGTLSTTPLYLNGLPPHSDDGLFAGFTSAFDDFNA